MIKRTYFDKNKVEIKIGDVVEITGDMRACNNRNGFYFVNGRIDDVNNHCLTLQKISKKGTKIYKEQSIWLYDTGRIGDVTIEIQTGVHSAAIVTYFKDKMNSDNAYNQMDEEIKQINIKINGNKRILELLKQEAPDDWELIDIIHQRLKCYTKMLTSYATRKEMYEEYMAYIKRYDA